MHKGVCLSFPPLLGNLATQISAFLATMPRPLMRLSERWSPSRCRRRRAVQCPWSPPACCPVEPPHCFAVPCIGARGCKQPRRDSRLGVQHGRPAAAPVPPGARRHRGRKAALSQSARHGYDASKTAGEKVQGSLQDSRQIQCASAVGAFGAATLRMSGTMAVAMTKQAQIARKVSEKVSVWA